MTEVAQQQQPQPLQDETQDLRDTLKNKINARRVSLTPVERFFLHGLLIDDPLGEDDETKEKFEHASRVLDDDMLFSVPEDLDESIREEARASKRNLKRPSMIKPPKDYRLQVGLWQAYEDGVSPKRLSKFPIKTIGGYDETSSALSTGVAGDSIPAVPNINTDDTDKGNDDDNNGNATDRAGKGRHKEEDVADDDESARSDEEVRREVDDAASDTSWDDKDGGFEHFNAWQVLKDEYAVDFGFDYKPDGAMPTFDDTELEHHTFKILGTSAEDKSAHPHVLSPPLMDALMTFVPEHLHGQNMWLKYSLVRDGASFDTFKNYVRSSKDTILAIETTKGEVFGCYTSDAWRTNPSFYGGAPSFVWKMRHNRNFPCHSLIEQAQLENEIDVFFLLQDGQRPQLCTSTLLAVGEGNMNKYDEFGRIEETEEAAEAQYGKNYGFAIALSDDLLSGTSSKCPSYKNPCLVDPQSTGETFEILNLELWTYTPCYSVDSAEKLEMTQFFVSESLRNTSALSSSDFSTGGGGGGGTIGGSSSSSRSRINSNSKFSSRELSQDQFYRRVGHNDEHEELRERWHYRNMMENDVVGSHGIASTPKFSNATS